MLRRLNKTLSKLIDHELRTAQLLFLFLSVGFTAFTIFGDNLPVKGPLKHEWLNGIDALAATVILVGLLFFKPIQIRYQQCVYVYHEHGEYLFALRYFVSYSIRLSVYCCLHYIGLVFSR